MIRMDPEAERNLAAEDLARFSMYTCVKAVNTGGGCVTVQQIPRRSTANAEEEFKEFACILSSCASANGGIPPVSVAYDGHLSFSKVNAFLLGLLPPHAFADVPFFQRVRHGDGRSTDPHVLLSCHGVSWAIQGVWMLRPQAHPKGSITRHSHSREASRIATRLCSDQS